MIPCKVLTDDDTSSIHALKTHLHRVFSIKDLGHLTFFLGIEIGYLPHDITMTQSKFTRERFSDSGLQTFKRLLLPFLSILNLTKMNLKPFMIHPYIVALIELNFLTHTRPVLSYTIQTLSQYLQHLSKQNFRTLEHTLNYVHFTTVKVIYFVSPTSFLSKPF